MSLFVFVGPTLTEAEARQWLAATYLPPVSQGDVASLLRYEPRAIAIIDGYFERVPAVWHKEILLALSRGVQVVGGASLGALRAAELHPFGMVGIGEIFEWYRDGLLDADDEVAVRHAPAAYGYRATSEALVNMRKTLQGAEGAGVLTADARATWVELARRIHYTDRTYPRLLDEGKGAGRPAAEVRRLRDFLATGRVDQKRADALALLRYLAALPAPAPVPFELAVTSKLLGLLEKDLCVAVVAGVRLTVEGLANQARMEHADFAGLQARARAAAHWLRVARRHALAVPPAARAALLAQWGLDRPQALAAWLDRNHLTAREGEALVDEWLLVAAARALPGEAAPPPDDGQAVAHPALLRQLRWEGDYEAVAHGAVAKERRAADAPPPDAEESDERALFDYYLRHKGLPATLDAERHAHALGFSHLTAFVMELARFYHYHQGR